MLLSDPRFNPLLRRTGITCTMPGICRLGPMYSDPKAAICDFFKRLRVA